MHEFVKLVSANITKRFSGDSAQRSFCLDGLNDLVNLLHLGIYIVSEQVFFKDLDTRCFASTTV